MGPTLGAGCLGLLVETDLEREPWSHYVMTTAPTTAGTTGHQIRVIRGVMDAATDLLHIDPNLIKRRDNP